MTQKETNNSLTLHVSHFTNHVSFPALNALLLFFIANLALQPLTEPDFGWHLRTGLDLLQHGGQMPITDPYSHTMPDWPWVEHAWLLDGLLGLIHQSLGSIGLLGVILFFAAVITGACLIAVSPAQTGWTTKLLAVAGALWVARPFLGARTQMITLLGLAVVLWLWRLAQTGRPAWLWTIPPLFLLWANLHGGFPAGLFVLSLILATSVAVRLVISRWPAVAQRLTEPIMSWPHLGRLAFVIGVAALLTFVNPYGWRLHQEIWSSLSDRFMLETLHEWQPFSLQSYSGVLYVAYLVPLGLAMLLCYRRVEPVRWMLWLVFLGLSFRHSRNIPFFLIVTLPLSAELLAELAGRAAGWLPLSLRHPRRWCLGATVLLAGAMITLGPDHLQRVVQSGLAPEAFFRETEYPIEAVQWIKANREKIGARLYNDYGHGGFLLWWLPEKKIFIDGRMPAWRIGSRQIFSDYTAVMHAERPALAVLDSYRVDWVMIKRNLSLETALGARRDWKQVYGDQKVAIFARRWAQDRR